MMRLRMISAALMTVVVPLAFIGCSDYRESQERAAYRDSDTVVEKRSERSTVTPPGNPDERPPQFTSEMEQNAQQARGMFIERDPTIQRFFDTAYACAVFPGIGKGAVGVGGAH